MHPAPSVIVFTVLSGAGFGLMFVLGLGYPILPGAIDALAASALAIGLAGCGLVASTFHLGHPERAWRALSQWRSSWLSREGAMALVTLALFGLYALAWIVFGARIAPLGAAASACACVCVVATAMIYAQLKTVPQWRTALTPTVYLLFALSAGWMIAGTFGPRDVAGAPTGFIAAILLCCAWTAKAVWWRRAARTGLASLGSTPESATGLGRLGSVRLVERPHTGPNYLTKEMVFRIGRKHANKIRLFAIACGALAPIAVCLLVAIAPLATFWLALAPLALLVGLFAERWLFFAEAEHAVALYY